MLSRESQKPELFAVGEDARKAFYVHNFRLPGCLEKVKWRAVLVQVAAQQDNS